jgi:hypothetical protein
MEGLNLFYLLQEQGGAPWGKGKLEHLKLGDKFEGIFYQGKIILGRVTHSTIVKLEGKFKNNGLEWGKRTNLGMLHV